MTRPAARPAIAAVLAAALVGCGGTSLTGPTQQPAAPSPQISLSAETAATAQLVRTALAGIGHRLEQAVQVYRPSEPASFATVPRAVLQADLADPDEGYVVVYQLPDVATATARGQEFADHLESGFGQTNYPLDAQFSLAQVGPTLVFTTWSRERAADAEDAEAVFDAIASVGEPIPIVK